VKRILQDPHCIGLGALGDHQIKTAHINVETVSKWCKGSLMILSGLDLGGLRDHQIKTPLKSCEIVSKWQKDA
jgi:hypothetical protein